MDEYEIRRFAITTAQLLGHQGTEELIDAAREIERYLRGTSVATPPTSVQQVVELRKAGLTRHAIAEKLGLAPGTVSVYIRRGGAPPHHIISEATRVTRRTSLVKARAVRMAKLAAKES